MESKAGSILLLISGILTFLVALGVLIFAIALPFLPNTQTDNPWLGFAVLLVIAIFLGIIGFIKLHASKLMKDPLTTNKGGIWALVVGILTSDLLSIIGGIIGLVQGGK